MGANKPPKEWPSGALDGLCSVAASGLGAKILPVDGGCDAPKEGFGPNNPPDVAGGVFSLLENNEGPLVVDAVNWNGLLGPDDSLDFFSSCFSSVGWKGFDEAPEKRLEDWNRF